ncbi:MAG: hypothetical protein MUF31_03865 [Akkermansiaceae bacterium]|jgi:hypothetical protein|nr:hypothetical protein [Akkermansiaceae bacterium]
MKSKTLGLPFLLLAPALLLNSCNVRYDTVSFHEEADLQDAKTPVPKIEIDTNITAGMFGGDVKSNKPYDIQAYYMDDTFTFASAEFTSLTVMYADGTEDPAAAAIKLPQVFQHRIHETFNSMDGGAVVVTKSRIVHAEFADIISRDEPFTLQIKGKFTKDDGTTIPFEIKRKYDISREKGIQSWTDFVSGC